MLTCGLGWTFLCEILKRMLEGVALILKEQLDMNFSTCRRASCFVAAWSFL